MDEKSQTKEEMDFDMHFAEQKKKYMELLSMIGDNFEELKKEYNTNPFFRSAINLLYKTHETQLELHYKTGKCYCSIACFNIMES